MEINKDVFEAEVNETYSNSNTVKKPSFFQKFKIGTIVSYLVFGTVCSFGGACAAVEYIDYKDSTVPVQDNVTTNNPSSTSQIVYVDKSGNYSIADATAMVKASVVEIQTEVVTKSSYFGQYVSSGAGSGVIYSNDGYIITNNHVIDGATNITVILNDGTKHTAKLIGTDSKTDLAVIKIEATGLQAAVFGNSDSLVVGEQVIAIGNPLGELGGSVTEGIISAKDREIQIESQTMTLLQTTAAVNPGNSGGGLFNLKGELVGIVNAKSSGSDVEGLGFAIPVTTAKDIITDLIDHGYVTGRPQLGIAGYEISDYYSAMRYGVNQLGVYVAEVTTNNGLEKGDLIVQVDDTMITNWAALTSVLDEHKIGDTLDIIVYRNGKQRTVKVTLTEYKPQ